MLMWVAQKDNPADTGDDAESATTNEENFNTSGQRKMGKNSIQKKFS